jgi:hypothetical protein
MRGDVSGIVTEKALAILERDASGPEPISERMFEIVYPDRSKPGGTRSAEFFLIPGRRPSSGCLPA